MKILAYCWSCNKEHDISNTTPKDYGMKCDCGGYVITPSGKVQSRIINDMVKLYQIYYCNETGWCTKNPKDFNNEVQDFNECEEWNIDIKDCIEKISNLNIGEKYDIEGLTFKCFEMPKEEYENLHEFAGW